MSGPRRVVVISGPGSAAMTPPSGLHVEGALGGPPREANDEPAPHVVLVFEEVEIEPLGGGLDDLAGRLEDAP